MGQGEPSLPLSVPAPEVVIHQPPSHAADRGLGGGSIELSPAHRPLPQTEGQAMLQERSSSASAAPELESRGTQPGHMRQRFPGASETPARSRFLFTGGDAARSNAYTPTIYNTRAPRYHWPTSRSSSYASAASSLSASDSMRHILTASDSLDIMLVGRQCSGATSQELSWPASQSGHPAASVAMFAMPAAFAAGRREGPPAWPIAAAVQPAELPSQQSHHAATQDSEIGQGRALISEIQPAVAPAEPRLPTIADHNPANEQRSSPQSAAESVARPGARRPPLAPPPRQLAGVDEMADSGAALATSPSSARPPRGGPILSVFRRLMGDGNVKP